MPPKRRRRFQGLYYHSSPPKVLPMNGQIANSNGRRTRGPDDFSVKLSTIRIWMHEKDIGKLTRVLWAGQGNRLRQQASTNAKVKRFLAAVPYVMNSIKDVHQAVIDNNLENLQSNLEPPVPPALVTCRDANGLNLIHKSAGLGHATILEYLITTWPDGVHETDITGKTPLHWAASAKNNMRCYTLLTQAGCDEEAVDYKMKTPSYYRHKPHEIERAFLAYVPEAPRVSPDVATDWEALSDESGDGKKPDIKIPEMNGFGRHSNAESNDNTSEAEMTEGTSGHEDEEAAEENDELVIKEDQNDEEAAEEESDNNNEVEDTKEQPVEEKEVEHDEETEKEKVEKNEEEKEKAEEKEREEEEQEEEQLENVSDAQGMLEEKDEPKHEKQQTQTLTETTENLTKDLQDEDNIESEDNVDSKEHEKVNKKDDSDNGDIKTEDKKDQAIDEEKSKEDLDEEQSDKNKEEQGIEQGKEKDSKETLETQASDESNKSSLNETKNEIEQNKLQEEEKENDKKKTDEATKSETSLKTGKENEKNNQENASKVKVDKDENDKEIEKSIQESVSEIKEDKNDNGTEKISQENASKVKEDKDETGKENGKCSPENEYEVKGNKDEFGKEDGKSSPENVSEVKEDEKEGDKNKDQENVSKVKEDGEDNDDNKDQDDSKTLGETLTDIKDEVKDNIKQLAHQIKNVFSDKDSKDDEEKDEIVVNEISDTKAETIMELNGEKENKEIEKEADKKLQERAAINDKDKKEEHNPETTKEPVENKENLGPSESNAKESNNQEKRQNADKQENKKPDGEFKQENDTSKESPQEQTLASSTSSSSDGQEQGSNNSNKTDESEIITKTDVPSSPNSNSLNENTPSNIQTPTSTALKTTTKESPKKNNDKTEEDENNNKSKLANKFETTATTVDITNRTEAITDEQFKEIDKSLEEYKKAEESSLQEKENDIGVKLEEMADNLKDNVKEMANKVMNVFSTANNTKGETEKLERESNDVVVHSESTQKQMSDKRSAKEGESSDDTADEDEEPQAETANDENSNNAEENNEPESDQDPLPALVNETNAEEEYNLENNEDKLDDEAATDGEGSPTPSLAIEGFVQGDAEDNTVQSQKAAYVDDDEETRLQNIIASGDMEQLAQIVLNGDGQKLLNVEATEPEIQAFLKNVPNYMDKIRRVHEAARQGSLLNLQQALDRRKFAIAKDEVSPNGATPLHVAVLFGNSDIVRYLSARFPETTTITDIDGRTPLHYAAVINDNGHFYNVLLQLGANPKVIDSMGHTPEDYLGKEELAGILNYGQLLKRFGAENLEEQLLNDQGRIENQSIQENPLFKTEQGKYLADNLADPLIKALTQVAQKRPNDPLQYLANYLQSYVTSRNTNGRTITQAAIIHSGSSKTDSTALISAEQSTPPITKMERQTVRMNGHIKYNATDDIEAGDLEKLDDFVNDNDYEDNDSDSALSKKLEERDDHGQSLLHFACARPQRKGSLTRVITESNIDITYRDELYRTARDVALQANKFANAKEIDNYVMSLAIVGDSKPFEHLACSGYDHIIDVSDDNETPIVDVVEAKGLHEMATYLRTIRPLEELREELHQMIRDNNVGRVKEIADGPHGKWLIKAMNYYGRTALHIAILKESVEIVEHFVHRCPEALKVGDNMERTPLHYAMGTNILESISRILIQNGAKRTNKDVKGRQPSYYFMNKADILRLQEEEDESR